VDASIAKNRVPRRRLARAAQPAGGHHRLDTAAARPPRDADRSGAIDIILGSAQQLDNLISGLLDVTAAESGHLTVEPRPVDPRTLLEEAAAALSAAAEIRGVALVCVGDQAPPAVMLDPARVRQVLYNFVSNALKHSPSGSTVTLRAAGDDQGVRFEVSDQGRGISAADQKELFQPYVRLAGAPSGTGLGLAVAREIADAHGGEIGVSSKPGRPSGCAFPAWRRRPQPRRRRRDRVPRVGRGCASK
jgi:signal transduction histidine kinase